MAPREFTALPRSPPVHGPLAVIERRPTPCRRGDDASGAGSVASTSPQLASPVAVIAQPSAEVLQSLSHLDSEGRWQRITKGNATEYEAPNLRRFNSDALHSFGSPPWHCGNATCVEQCRESELRPPPRALLVRAF